MDAATFWNLIETAKIASENDCEQQAQLLQQYLILLPIEEVSSFDQLPKFGPKGGGSDLESAATRTKMGYNQREVS
jgi:hypothetical protein